MATALVRSGATGASDTRASLGRSRGFHGREDTPVETGTIDQLTN